MWDCGVGRRKGFAVIANQIGLDGRKLGEMGTIEPGVEWALKVSLHSDWDVFL